MGEEQDPGLGIREPGSEDGRWAVRLGTMQMAVPYRVPRKRPEFALNHESLKVLDMVPIEWRKRKQRMKIDAAFAFPEVVGPQRVGATRPSPAQNQGEKVGLLPDEVQFSVDGEKVQLGEKAPNPEP